MAGLAALAGFAFLVALGNWQMRRLDWKQGLIGAIAERQHAAPVTLALAEERASLGGDVEYTRVKVDGQLLNDQRSTSTPWTTNTAPAFTSSRRCASPTAALSSSIAASCPTT